MHNISNKIYNAFPRWIVHENVVKWELFFENWSFVRNLKDSPQKETVTRTFGVSFYLGWTSNYTQLFSKDIITYPYPNPDAGLANLY